MQLVKLIVLSTALNSTALIASELEPGTTATLTEKTRGASSAANRAEQKFSVGTRAGLLHTFVPGVGLEANYNLSPTIQIGASANTASLKGASSSDDDKDSDDKASLDRMKIQSQSYGVHGRWFPGNSFYVVSGLSNRVVKTEMSVSENENDANAVATKTNGDAWCLDLGVGNQWNFGSGFYIGAEWFGISQPLVARSNHSAQIRGTVSEDLQKSSDDYKSLADSMAKGTSFRLGMMTVGWAF